MSTLCQSSPRRRKAGLGGYLHVAHGLAFGLLLLLLAVGQAQASEEGKEKSLKLQKEVDGYKVELIFVEGRAQTGDNKVKVELHDTEDRPVGNAKVTVGAELNIAAAKDSGKKDTHRSATEIGERAKAVELKSGRETGEYVGQVKFHDDGNWNLKVTFVVQKQQRSATFALDVVEADVFKWYVIWGFVSVNVAIFIAAAATRKKAR